MVFAVAERWKRDQEFREAIVAQDPHHFLGESNRA
jgi:hypothetical protein